MFKEEYKFGKYMIEIYNDPSKNLSQKLQEKLIRECMPVAKNGFGEQHVDEDAVRRRLLQTSTSIVIRNYSKHVVGVAGSSILNLDGDMVIYLQGSIILKKYQNFGLYNIAVAARIMTEVKKLENKYTNKEKIFIGTRTQSPIVYRIMHRKLGLFPYPNGYVDKNIKKIATKFSKNIYLNHSDYKPSEINLFDDNVFVTRRALKLIKDEREISLNMYENRIPFCKDDEEINEYMKENLNWNNGDALIMVGRYRQQDIVKLFPSIESSSFVIPWD